MEINPQQQQMVMMMPMQPGNHQMGGAQVVMMPQAQAQPAQTTAQQPTQGQVMQMIYTMPQTSMTQPANQQGGMMMVPVMMGAGGVGGVQMGYNMGASTPSPVPSPNTSLSSSQEGTPIKAHPFESPVKGPFSRNTGASYQTDLPGPLGASPARKNNRRRRRTDHQQAEDIPTSPLMEQFRAQKAKDWPLERLRGHVYEFSRDQDGSRMIQKCLEDSSCTEENKNMVFAEIAGAAAPSLMMDVFGNYVVQKLFEYGSPQQRSVLCQSLKGHVLELALQTYGCRVIQKALEVIERREQIELAEELDGHVLRCVLDQNGNHVVQKCIERIDPPSVAFIVRAFQGSVQRLAVHAYGCRVIQRILEYCEDHTSILQPILDEIIDTVTDLVRDQYGNYVVQHVLINGRPGYQLAIVEGMRPHVLALSQHKFASNVVERMFLCCNREIRNIIIEDLLKPAPTDEESSCLCVMMRDQYANYVVQQILEHCDEAQRKLLVEHIRPHIASLRRFTYGKHIIARIESSPAL